MKELGKIVNSGMGGFLNPPTHPTHSFHVQYDLSRRAAERGCMSLECAVNSGWLDKATTAKAKALLDGWVRPSINAPEIQDWIRSILGYFRACYMSETHTGEEAWCASYVRVLTALDPVENADIHCGVHYIRKFYPEFIPTREHFKGAYWGSKPSKAA